MADRSFSPDDIRLYELLQQFLCLSDSTERAGTIVIISPEGLVVGDCTLSADDIEAATDALLRLNIQRADHTTGLEPADPLPVDENDDEAIAAISAEAEAFLKNGGTL